GARSNCNCAPLLDLSCACTSCPTDKLPEKRRDHGWCTVCLRHRSRPLLTRCNACKALTTGRARCPLLALSGHSNRAAQCPLLRVKRTCRLYCEMSAFDPKRTWAYVYWVSATEPKMTRANTVLLTECYFTQSINGTAG